MFYCAVRNLSCKPCGFSLCHKNLSGTQCRYCSYKRLQKLSKTPVLCKMCQIWLIKGACHFLQNIAKRLASLYLSCIILIFSGGACLSKKQLGTLKLEPLLLQTGVNVSPAAGNYGTPVWWRAWAMDHALASPSPCFAARLSAHSICLGTREVYESLVWKTPYIWFHRIKPSCPWLSSVF